MIRSCPTTFTSFLERNSVFLSRIATFQPPRERNAVIHSHFTAFLRFRESNSVFLSRIATFLPFREWNAVIRSQNN